MCKGALCGRIQKLYQFIENKSSFFFLKGTSLVWRRQILMVVKVATTEPNFKLEGVTSSASGLSFRISMKTADFENRRFKIYSFNQNLHWNPEFSSKSAYSIRPINNWWFPNDISGYYPHRQPNSGRQSMANRTRNREKASSLPARPSSMPMPQVCFSLLGSLACYVHKDQITSA